jgi:flagellar motor switch/type III secretory pathway protein FliN
MTEAQTIGEEGGGTALLRRADGASGEVAQEAKLQLDRIAGLPVQVDVRIPLPNFRVADVLSLAAGSVVASEWATSDDIPLCCGAVHLVWTEFEVVDDTLAVRVTRLV